MSVIPEAAIAFVADLLLTPSDSMDHLVGQWVWDVLGDGTRDDLFDAVTNLMTIYKPQSRAFEIGYDIWRLLGGQHVTPGVTYRSADAGVGFIACLRDAGLLA